MREAGLADNDLAERLGSDIRFPLETGEIEEILSRSRGLTGLAGQQVESFAHHVEELAGAFPGARSIEKGRLL